MFVDSDYATDKKDRKSVTGFIATIGGSVVNWKSKKQSGITLSSTEAEFVALSTASTEVVYLNNLLKEIFEKQFSGVVYEDNQGAIFLANNQQLGQRTKHIDVRYKYTNECIEKGELRIVYVKSEDNVADLVSKGTATKVFAKLSDIVLNGQIQPLLNCESN